MTFRHLTRTKLILWCAVAISTLLFGIRVLSAIDFQRPFLGFTSGCEEEALFTIWKAANGHEIYNSPWLPPFSGSYFGWLFYESYGLWSKITLNTLMLEDAWLPTFARGFTIVGVIVGIILFARTLRQLNNPHDPLCWLTVTAIACLIFINPLFHWWSFTARADIWALVFELAALSAAIAYCRGGSYRSLTLVAILSYLAWSFRQTNISVLIGIGCWLLIEKKWRHLIQIVLITGLLFLTTTLMLGKNFFDSAFVANALSGELISSVAAGNAASALKKAPWLLVALSISLYLISHIRKWWADGITRLTFITATTSMALCVFLSSKVGASTNYYLPLPITLTLFVIAALSQTDARSAKTRLFLEVGALTTGAACLMVFCGISGNLRLPSDRAIQNLRALRPSLKQPIFCTDRIGNLPWILGSDQRSYVFGYAYGRLLAAKPEKFKSGTISQHIKNGEFSTLVISNQNSSYKIEDDEIRLFSSVIKTSEFSVFEKRGMNP